MVDDLDFHYASDTDWDRVDARDRGAADPNVAWILTDRDVWHANPFYKGPSVPHPEEYEDFDLSDDAAIALEDKFDPYADIDF